MSAQARAIELLNAWRDGKGQPHVQSCGQWGGDDCARCVADRYDAWEAFRAAASILGIPGYTFPDGKPTEGVGGMTGCGKTPAGGWHCEGSGCLDAGRVCMHDAAAPAGTLTLVLGSTDSLFASGGFTVVGREALGLEPSAAYLLREHMRRVHDALNDQGSRLLERAFLPPSLRRPEPGADCG